MNSQRLEYLSKDTPTIKKDLTLRLLFAALFIGIFIWQFVLLVQRQAEVSGLMITLSAVTMVFSAMFGFTSLLYAMNALNSLNRIKNRGKAVVYTKFVYNIDKRSFLRLYQLITSILAVLALVLLVSCITYSALAYVYYNSISFYLPMISAFVVWCFNSSYHLKNEIFISQTVNRCNSIYY